MTLDIEDTAELLAYLRRGGRVGKREDVTARVLTGGVSCRTVLVERAAGPSLVVKQALAKLRVAVDWYSDPARIRREADALRVYAALLPPGSTPAFAFEDAAAELFAMSAVADPAATWKARLLAGDVDLELARQFGALLGVAHRAAVERAAELRLRERFGDLALFESLRVEPYYRYGATREPRAAAFVDALVADLAAHRDTLVHGDYSPKNFLVRDTHLVLLDFEVAHWGDPAFDLGFGYTHLLSKAHHLPARRAALAEAVRVAWRAYAAETSVLPWFAPLERRAVRNTLGCLLARVVGRSPLEYLTPAEAAAQRERVVALLPAPPERVDALVDAFLEDL